MLFRRTLVALSILLPVAGLFGGALLRGDVLAGRDVSNFYYPLFQWECRQWRECRVPLWSPQDNLGMPLLADGSSSVFYPGKLVFALPLDFARRFTLYVTLHLVCAAWAAYFAARRFGASVEAAGLAAVSYTLGGNVLYHYSNVIFLVGAAWLPLALLAGHQMLVLRSWRWASLLAVVLALMILGGDPQTAYHVLLLAGFYGVLRAWGRRRFTKPARVRSGRGLLQNLPRQRWVLLAAATAGAGLLAAVQILPAAEWTRVSERAAYRVPRSVWETIGFLRGHAPGKGPDPPASRFGRELSVCRPRGPTMRIFMTSVSVPGGGRKCSGRTARVGVFPQIGTGSRSCRPSGVPGRHRYMLACCPSAWHCFNGASVEGRFTYGGFPGWRSWACWQAWAGMAWGGSCSRSVPPGWAPPLPNPLLVSL